MGIQFLHQSTWVAGTNTGSQPGSYGAQGIASSGNSPGGRDSAVGWIDSGNHLWLFGGQGIDSGNQTGALNDVWEFDASTSQWTWRAGSNRVNQLGAYGTPGTAGAANVRGARHSAAAWKDASGTFWLFGGTGLDAGGSGAGELNDLWRFNPS